MIDFPTGSSSSGAPVSGSSAASGSSTASASSAAGVSSTDDAVSATVASKVDALVLEVKARQDSGNLTKPAWDILLKLNPATTATPQQSLAAVSSITPADIRTLQAGQSLLVQTSAPFSLPVNTRLQVNVSAVNGVQIQSTPSPQAALAAQLALIKLLAPQQQSLAPLLANLLLLVRQDMQSTLNALPAAMQSAIQNLLETLPESSQIQQPGQLRAAVENSGLLREARLAAVVAQAQPGGAGKAASAIETTVAGNVQIATGAKAVTAQESGWKNAVSSHLRDVIQRLVHSADSHTSVDPLKTSGADRASLQASLNAVLGADIKHALMQLEKALQANPAAPAASTSASSGTATTGTANVVADEQGPANAAQQKLPDEKSPAQKTQLVSPELARRMQHASGQPVATSRSNDDRAAQHLAIQRYAAATSQRTEALKTTGYATDLLPPVPGQVVVQAQPRALANLKHQDLADAIVKTLLNQVRGALARVTLHQISSASHKTDAAPQTSISFDIPIVNGGQADVFQFRIEEDETTQQEQQAKTTAKRWVVQLGFDIEGLGPMFCQLTMSGKSLAVSFWAAWEQTLSQTKAHFSFLERSLNDMGIQVEKIQAQLGMPEQDKTGIRNQLVDIKT